MKNNNQTKASPNTHKGLDKSVLLGFLVGAFLGFFVAFVMSDGKLPFADSHSVIGNMKGLITIFYLFSIVGGGVLGLITGIIIGVVAEANNK